MRRICNKKKKKKKKKADFLAVDEACKAILRPTPSFKVKAFHSSGGVFCRRTFIYASAVPRGERERGEGGGRRRRKEKPGL